MAEAEARIPRLSVVQAMKLVVYCAVGMACVAPMVRLLEATGGPVWAALLFGAVAAPLAWAVLSFLLVHPGAARDRLIAAHLLGSVATALGLAVWFLWIHSATLRGWRRRDFSSFAAEFAGFAVHLGLILLLTAAALFLARRVVRRPRPDPADRHPSRT